MKTKRHDLAFALACVALLGATMEAQAASVILGPGTPLGDLISSSGTMTVESLVFGNFTYGKTGQMPDAGEVNVIPILDTDGNPGIRFQGGFIDDPSPGSSDALIEYTVSAAAAIIFDAHISGNPDLLAGAGIAAVTETFLPDVSSDSMSVFDNGTVEQLVDSIVFAPPLQQVSVQKNMQLLADAGSVAATVSFIDQSFSVPEPTTGLMILPAAILGLMYRRRKP